MNDIDIAGADLNLLKVFEALFEEGSASRAALRLNLTQSAVSAALGRLHELYGEQLFRRTGHGLAPTLLANQLKPVISEALAQVRHSLSMAAPASSAYSGRSVTIGMSDDFEIALGARLIAQVAQRAPQLRLIFRQTHSQIVADALLGRSMDLAITAGGAASRLLSRDLLGEGQYACVVDGSHHPAEQTFDLHWFVRHDHLLISAGGFIGIVDEALAEQGLKRRVGAATTHFAALPYLLTGSTAIATLPLHAAQAITAISHGLRLVACPLPLRRYPVELAWRNSASPDNAVLIVREAIRELVSAERYFVMD